MHYFSTLLTVATMFAFLRAHNAFTSEWTPTVEEDSEKTGKCYVSLRLREDFVADHSY